MKREVGGLGLSHDHSAKHRKDELLAERGEQLHRAEAEVESNRLDSETVSASRRTVSDACSEKSPPVVWPCMFC